MRDGGVQTEYRLVEGCAGPPVLLSNTPPGRLDSSRPLHVSGGLWRAVLPVIGEICSFGLQLQETLQLFTF